MLDKKNGTPLSTIFFAIVTACFFTQSNGALAQAGSTPASSNQSTLADRVNSSEQDYTSPQISSDQAFSPLGLACDLTLNATKSVGAMVTLTFKAPCHAHEIITITHQGLQFTTRTSEVGHATVQLPVLVAAASFDVTLLNGSTISTTAHVPEVSDYHRVALQWTGESGLEIHALEIGTAHGQRGRIITLGKLDFPTAKHVKIYSFPTAQMQTSGVVRLGLNAKVTAKTCNKEIKVQTLQSGVTGGISITDLALLMPSCDAIGDVLMLNNILRDLKIEQN